MAADMPSSNLWSELKTKREQLPSIHQEFELSRTSKTTSAERSSKQQLILDVSRGQWREKTVSGSGTEIRIYDGTDVFWMEEGDDEFVRVKPRMKKGSTGNTARGI